MTSKAQSMSSIDAANRRRKDVKRLCTNEMPTHKEASAIMKQLRVNPEVCDNCKIKPCTYGQYVFGKKGGE
ncbi:hypothetical protein LCGC14_0580840 [marine sediment metagenome]|uniref:Uncharacterized protein n=1 Tax=marine sediment metagenome TaxID=412755 RepID=A0A0F9S055_9ZZZZ